MTKQFIFLSAFILLLTSCQDKTTKKETVVDPDIVQGQQLFEQRCIVCHGTEGKTEADMLAPPFFAVKRQYLRFSMDEADFKASMKAYILNPDEHNALMKPAVENMGVMPQQSFQDGELDKIIKFVYQNEFDKPDWFDAHEAMHRKGQQHKH